MFKSFNKMKENIFIEIIYTQNDFIHNKWYIAYILMLLPFITGYWNSNKILNGVCSHSCV